MANRGYESLFGKNPSYRYGTGSVCPHRTAPNNNSKIASLLWEKKKKIASSIDLGRNLSVWRSCLCLTFAWCGSVPASATGHRVSPDKVIVFSRWKRVWPKSIAEEDCFAASGHPWSTPMRALALISSSAWSKHGSSPRFLFLLCFVSSCLQFVSIYNSVFCELVMMIISILFIYVNDGYKLRFHGFHCFLFQLQLRLKLKIMNKSEHIWGYFAIQSWTENTSTHWHK